MENEGTKYCATHLVLLFESFSAAIFFLFLSPSLFLSTGKISPPEEFYGGFVVITMRYPRGQHVL